MLQIRRMTENDLDAVAKIAATLFTLPWKKDGFAEALPMENAIFLVAQEDETIAGYCGLFMAADEGELINVAVHPDFQKRGIAGSLLREVLQAGRENGISRFFLEVRISNLAALRLYEKNGFVIQGIRKAFYKMPREDAFVMNLIEE